MQIAAKVNGCGQDALSRNLICLWAFVLSIAIHLGLVFCGRHWNGNIGNGTLPGGRGTQLSVWLVAPVGDTGSAVKGAMAVAPRAAVEAKHVPVSEKNGEIKPEGAGASGADGTVDLHAREASSAPLMPMPEPHYFRLNELTEKPQLLRDIPANSLEGFPDVFTRPLLLRLLINERGRVDKVLIEEAMVSRKGKHFLETAFSKVRFLPGKLGAMPVKTQIDIEVSLQNAPIVVSPPVLLKP